METIADTPGADMIPGRSLVIQSHQFQAELARGQVPSGKRHHPTFISDYQAFGDRGGRLAA